MPDVARRADLDGRGASPSHLFRWLVARVGTRAAAAAWWVVMVAFALLVIGWWVNLVRHPTPANAVLVVGLTVIVGLPLAREWQHAGRMGRMVRHGT